MFCIQYELGINPIGGIVEQVAISSYQTDVYIAYLVKQIPGCVVFENNGKYSAHNFVRSGDTCLVYGFIFDFIYKPVLELVV